jgi:hypothetical protein
MLSSVFGYAEYYFVINKLRMNVLPCGFKCHRNGLVLLLSQFVQLTMKFVVVESRQAWRPGILMPFT